MDMWMQSTDLIKRLTEEYRDYNTRIEKADAFDSFIIINPFWCENIRVSLDDEMIMYFSFHHAHCDASIDYLIEYINGIISEMWVAIEFFEEDSPLFGGCRHKDEIDISSGKSLIRSFTGENESLYDHLFERLQGHNCRCSIRGWNNVDNKDFDFEL